MMIATFKEFKQKIIRNIFQNQNQLQFASRRLTWAGHEYLLCRAVIPDIAEMLEIQRQVYGGQVPWNEEVFRKELSQKKPIYIWLSVTTMNWWPLLELTWNVTPNKLTLPILLFYRSIRDAKSELC